MKQTVSIRYSSMALWLYKDGDMKNPVRARSDANGDVFIGNIQPIMKDGKYSGESSTYHPEDYLEYSPAHIIKIRSGWDYFTDEKHYGEIKITASKSQRCN